MKIYIAHPISNDYEARASIELAQSFRDMGFDVYAAVENKIINDKAALLQPTPLSIYDHDMSELIECDLMVVNVTGGDQDGTISEIGVISGLNEAGVYKCKPILAYTSNARLQNPQMWQGIPSARANHLVLGMIAKWGKMFNDQDSLIDWFDDIAGINDVYFKLKD